MTEVVYKIVVDGKYCWKTLFYGIKRSRFLPFEKWLKADKKMVKDGSGGQEYLSGIHCFKDFDVAINYLSKFRTTTGTGKRVIECFAKHLRQKPTNKDVYLADEIFISSQK